MSECYEATKAVEDVEEEGLVEVDACEEEVEPEIIEEEEPLVDADGWAIAAPKKKGKNRR